MANKKVGLVLSLVVVMMVFVGCDRANTIISNVSGNDTSPEVRIIGASEPREVPGMGHAGTELFYAGPTPPTPPMSGIPDKEIFGVHGYPGVMVGSTIRIGIGHEPTVDTLVVEGDPELISEIVYFSVNRELIESLRSYDSVEIRIEVLMPSGGFLNNNSLKFIPGVTEPNPPVNCIGWWDNEAMEWSSRQCGVE